MASDLGRKFPWQGNFEEEGICMHFVSFVIEVTSLKNLCVSVPCLIVTASWISTLEHVQVQSEVSNVISSLRNLGID